MIKPGTLGRINCDTGECVRPTEYSPSIADIDIPLNTIVEIQGFFRTHQNFYYVWIPTLNVYVGILASLVDII